jgi:predicted nucleic acid-binding Zn ribbon protein
MKLPKRCTISHKTTSKDEGHSRESFVKKAQAMMMYGMTILIMVTMLLMMLLP